MVNVVEIDCKLSFFFCSKQAVLYSTMISEQHSTVTISAICQSCTFTVCFISVKTQHKKCVSERWGVLRVWLERSDRVKSLVGEENVKQYRRAFSLLSKHGSNKLSYNFPILSLMPLFHQHSHMISHIPCGSTERDGSVLETLSLYQRHNTVSQS